MLGLHLNLYTAPIITFAFLNISCAAILVFLFVVLFSIFQFQPQGSCASAGEVDSRTRLGYVATKVETAL